MLPSISPCIDTHIFRRIPPYKKLIVPRLRPNQIPPHLRNQLRKCYNFHMLEERISQSLIKHCGADPNLPLIVGVSGGADSLCLLHCLKEGGFKLIIGHLDHALRQNSAAQAETLRQHAADLAGRGPRAEQGDDARQFILDRRLKRVLRGPHRRNQTHRPGGAHAFPRQRPDQVAGRPLRRAGGRRECA